MNVRAFIQALEDQRIIEAIREVESRTSGELRVLIHHGLVKDALIAARKRFEKLGMAKTAQRNAVLIFVAPRSRALAVFADEGIHSCCDAAVWKRLVSAMESSFGCGQFTDGLVVAIRQLGDLLVEHFPREDGDVNELPDAVVRVGDASLANRPD